MEETVLVRQCASRNETTIKCDKSVRKIEVVFDDKYCRVKNIIIERKVENHDNTNKV